MNNNKKISRQFTRREFLKTAAAGLAGEGVAFNETGSLLAVGGNDGVLRVFAVPAE